MPSLVSFCWSANTKRYPHRFRLQPTLGTPRLGRWSWQLLRMPLPRFVVGIFIPMLFQTREQVVEANRYRTALSSWTCTAGPLNPTVPHLLARGASSPFSERRQVVAWLAKRNNNQRVRGNPFWKASAGATMAAPPSNCNLPACPPACPFDVVIIAPPSSTSVAATVHIGHLASGRGTQQISLMGNASRYSDSRRSSSSAKSCRQAPQQ